MREVGEINPVKTFLEVVPAVRLVGEDKSESLNPDLMQVVGLTDRWKPFSADIVQKRLDENELPVADIGHRNGLVNYRRLGSFPEA